MLSGVCDNGRAEERFVDSHKEACSELESLQDLADKKGLQKESLKKVLEHLASHYGHDHPVILFSRSDDDDEISEAAEYAHKHLRNDITVVALSGREKPWRKFPAISVYPVDVSDLDASDGLDYCIAERSCAIANECE
ncbi:hypothetical protein ANCCAN_11943 [Ancylostoma caninum]|uniref:Uncharacterized protein n=1 Tax=Ancylostoma caninum TaxID=29170 RepID=A0A368GCF1_ANCCA|nr:hypothetical protein ANCCAN_11943 [Ancylostoma caninum]